MQVFISTLTDNNQCQQVKDFIINE